MEQLPYRKDSAGPRNILVASLRKAALAAAITFGLMSSSASFGATKLEVVVFGDSLLDAGTYSPVAEAKFGGGRFTTNPGLNFTQKVARSFGSELKPAFVGGFGLPLTPAGG
jgi:phospholipase/lecithinase/hemolysin